MMVAPRAPGPASANLQWRKPREGIRKAVRRELSKIECRAQFRFRSPGIFEEPGPRIRAQLWRYGTSIAYWGNRFLSPCDFKELRVIKRARFTTSTLAASQHSLNSITRTDR